MPSEAVRSWKTYVLQLWGLQTSVTGGRRGMKKAHHGEGRTPSPESPVVVADMSRHECVDPTSLNGKGGDAHSGWSNRALNMMRPGQPGGARPGPWAAPITDASVGVANPSAVSNGIEGVCSPGSSAGSQSRLGRPRKAMDSEETIAKRIATGCHLDPESGALIPGCMGTAAFDISRCTCYSTGTRERIRSLERRIRALEHKRNHGV
jgi:hypothetical protein